MEDPRRAQRRADRWPERPGEAPDAVDVVVFDVDGTLVDTAYLHVHAWARAFADLDLQVPMSRIHRAMGLGGDRLVTHLTGRQTEEALGEELRKSWEEHYQELLPEVRAFADADALLRDLAERGVRVVLASSGKPDHLARALDVLGADDAISAVVRSDDAESPPEPGLVDRAADVVGATDAVMVGDSVWDVVAASRGGFPTVGVLTGGAGREDLTRAGAHLVVHDPTELRARIGELLGRLGRTRR